jgi:hypothetical protein
VTVLVGSGLVDVGVGAGDVLGGGEVLGGGDVLIVGDGRGEGSRLGEGRGRGLRWARLRCLAWVTGGGAVAPSARDPISSTTLPRATRPVGRTASTTPAGTASLACQRTRTSRPSRCSWRRAAGTGSPRSRAPSTSTIAALGGAAAGCRESELNPLIRIQVAATASAATADSTTAWPGRRLRLVQAGAAEVRAAEVRAVG